MVRAAEDLERGREFYARLAWTEAYESLSRADAASQLGPEDIELLARSAYMIGLDDDYRGALERAHQAYVEAGERRRAARCAWWIGHNHLFRGESAPATGWFARGHRLLDSEAGECVEQGYLLIPALLRQFGDRDLDGAHATAAEIAATGERFGDRDLLAIGLMEQGRALVWQGRTAEGLRLVDETMVAVTAGELSPIVAGIVYCNTIAFCRDVYELRRAREWTVALTRWCDEQPDMVAHKGLCLVHRAEIMTLGGAWQDALDEARHVGERFTEGVLNERALGHAAYRQGEIHRLRGEFHEAEDAFRRASRLGREPQPGLALLRLARGQANAAAGAIRRKVSEVSGPLERAALLPAYVEITVAIGDLEAAEAAGRELAELARRQGSEMLDAMAEHARGALELARGDARAALMASRGAWHAWSELGAPYEAARVRVLIGQSCRLLGDEDTAALELDAARSVFAHLGAGPDLGRVDSLLRSARPGTTHGLTPRELEVLRLVASGRSNREIASRLVISERTVARHIQNIFVKLRVSSRTAAGAFAYEHDLV
jgi:DNA-binding CsgD family transcriptional regulator/tetratricopeptide (TPR) repeat protein